MEGVRVRERVDAYQRRERRHEGDGDGGLVHGHGRAQVEHALSRRLKYYTDKTTKPDLLLIDGGKTQLKFANSIIKNSKHPSIKVISIVKGANRVRATETILSIEGVIEIDKYSKGYLLLQEIRDESHRFAISAQRKKKIKLVKKSFLDDIKGIGPKTKLKLIKKFKSIKNIKNSSIEELMTIPGINEKIAKVIKLSSSQ